MSTETSTDLIRQYLQSAIASEKNSETQFRAFAEEGDDAEVQAAFVAHAEETRIQSERLAERLQMLGETGSAPGGPFANLVGMTAKSLQLGAGQEGRVAQNLMTAFAAEKTECAMYEALASVAAAAGDRETEGLARDIQAQESATAEKIWRFIPTRSKIAFNILTAGEIDPAIETKAPDDRIISRDLTR